jgi:hypothetical protein
LERRDQLPIGTKAKTQLEPGDRVHIKGHWNWPSDCSGVIAAPPSQVADLSEDSEPWRGHIRTVRGRTGMISFVWIVFDTAQLDGDGDGPYRAGEVELEFVAREAVRDEPDR